MRYEILSEQKDKLIEKQRELIDTLKSHAENIKRLNANISHLGHFEYNSKSVSRTYDKIQELESKLYALESQEELKPNNRTAERDMAVIYENYVKDNNITGETLTILQRLYAKLYSEVSFPSKPEELKPTDEDFPEIDFREQMANEMTRDELIDRLCEFHKSYTEMRKEWFEVVQLGKIPTSKTESKNE